MKHPKTLVAAMTSLLAAMPVFAQQDVGEYFAQRARTATEIGNPQAGQLERERLRLERSPGGYAEADNAASVRNRHELGKPDVGQLQRKREQSAQPGERRGQLGRWHSGQMPISAATFGRGDHRVRGGRRN